MPLPDFTDQLIQETYQRVIQTDGSTLYNGTGSIISTLNITASHAISASYAVSASHEIIKEVSSSFADTASYVTPLNQDVTVAGNISASGDLAIQGFPSVSSSLALAGLPADTGSLLTTASVSSNTITFTKGDSSTFDITVATGSGGGTPINTGSLMVTGSVSSNTLTFTKGDGTTFDLIVDTGSGGGGGSAFPFTGSAQIQGLGTTLATSALTVENATPTTIFDLKDNGQFTVGPSNDSISVASNGRVTIAASAPDLTIGGGNYLDFPGGAGTIDGVRFINRTGDLRISSTDVRFGNTGTNPGAIVNIAGKDNKTPFGIRQQNGTSNNILATFQDGSGNTVMGITADGGFTVTDSNLVKRYVLEHGYSPSPADGMGIGLDLKTEDSNGTIKSVGAIDVIQDDVSADESSMRLSVGETTPVEIMRLESSGNVGINNTAPDPSAILDIASTTKGVVFPRMTETQRTAISSPTTGLIVYQTDATEGLYIFKSTGWVQVI